MALESVPFDVALQQALDKMADSRINQGSDEWESTFLARQHEVTLVDALYYKHQFAIILLQLDMEAGARQVDSEIYSELEDDADRDEPMISDDDRRSLMGLVLSPYESRTSSSEDDRREYAHWPASPFPHANSDLSPAPVQTTLSMPGENNILRTQQHAAASSTSHRNQSANNTAAPGSHLEVGLPRTTMVTTSVTDETIQEIDSFTA